METTTENIKIGPLTGNEWALLVTEDDELNPLPRCCGNVSDLRDALIGAFRAGGDPDRVWRRIASQWELLEGHAEPGVPLHPVLAKLHAAYVAGRETPTVEDGFAHLLAQEPQNVITFVDSVSEMWDINTRQGQLAAIARIGGDYVGYILDADARYACAERLAGVIGWDDVELCMMIDVLRAAKGLPYEVTHPDVREG